MFGCATVTVENIPGSEEANKTPINANEIWTMKAGGEDGGELIYLARLNKSGGAGKVGSISSEKGEFLVINSDVYYRELGKDGTLRLGFLRLDKESQDGDGARPEYLMGLVSHNPDGDEDSIILYPANPARFKKAIADKELEGASESELSTKITSNGEKLSDFLSKHSKEELFIIDYPFVLHRIQDGTEDEELPAASKLQKLIPNAPKKK
jgi:hypothetical protein